MSCKINLKDLSPEDRMESILYITHDIIIYKKMNQIVLASCDGTILSEHAIPIDSENYEFLEFDDAILFLFNGIDFLLIDKTGMIPEYHKFDLNKLGRCITKPHKTNDSNRIILGTKKEDRIQFINYDFVMKQRIAQTSSWTVSKITNVLVDGMVLYAVFDDSTIIACDMNTGETLWNRFETAKIGKGIVIQNNNLIYCCQDMLKKIKNEEMSSTRIPLVSPFSIEHFDSRHVYFTSNNGKNICSYNTVSENLEWQIYGHRVIQESITTQNTDDNDLLLLRTNDYVSVINLSTGEAEQGVRSPNAHRLRKSTDHIFIQKTTGGTALIPGEAKNEFDD